MDLELAKLIITAIESRYPEGFIYHTYDKDIRKRG